MEAKWILSLQDGIAALSPQGQLVLCAPLAGAGALCADKQNLFCADESGAIWRFDRRTMMPAALGCGGPGICSMCLSPCGARLYALLAEADSVLMSDAHSGKPLALNRCGCCPRMLGCCPDGLVAAGGESGCVYVYHARTLEVLDEIQMPGPVYSAVLCGGVLYALCLTAQLNTLLAVKKDGSLHTLPLPGMPGCLAIAEDSVYAAVQGGIYIFSGSTRSPVCMLEAPGRASKLFVLSGRLVLYDPLSECVYAASLGSGWRRICSAVKDVCAL
ncbi:MAG: hypothetical protein IKU38_01290 [Clostridia bacterium]|nr:hypothetical protein [Clostridia bacterium]